MHFSSQYVIELPYGLLAKNTTYCGFKYPPYTIYCIIFAIKKSFIKIYILLTFKVDSSNIKLQGGTKQNRKSQSLKKPIDC